MSQKKSCLVKQKKKNIITPTVQKKRKKKGNVQGRKEKKRGIKGEDNVPTTTQEIKK